MIDTINEEALDHIKKIKARAEITRSAHATIGKRYGFASKFIKIILLIGSMASTILIFTQNFNEYTYLLMAGVFSFILFVLSLIELVLNFEKNAETHNQAGKLYTALIRNLNRAQEIKMIEEKTLDDLQEKYDWILESSPWIPDREFLEAKRRFKIKRDINKILDDESSQGKSIKQLENEIVSQAD